MILDYSRIVKRERAPRKRRRARRDDAPVRPPGRRPDRLSVPRRSISSSTSCLSPHASLSAERPFSPSKQPKDCLDWIWARFAR